MKAQKNVIKILALLCTLALLLPTVLGGCGVKDGPSDSDTEPQSLPPDFDGIATSVNSVGLEKFVIVYENDSLFRASAQRLQKIIAENRGYELELKKDDGKENEYEILFGNTQRRITSKYYKAPYKVFTTYKIEVVDNKIAVLATEKTNMEIALEELASRFFDADGTLTEITNDHSFSGDVYSNEGIAIEQRTNVSDIRIASNNIYCHQKASNEKYSVRKDPLLKSFALMDADVLMLQECGYSKMHSPSKTTWHEEIDGELEKMGYTMVDVELEKGASMNYTPIWYRADKLKLIDAYYNLYDSVKQSPDTYLSNSKSYTRAVFEDKETGKQFACISTHFTWAANPTWAGQLRTQDAEEAKLEVLSLKEKYGEDFPIILMGDLNTDPQTPPYKILDEIMEDARLLEGTVQNNTKLSTSHVLGIPPGNGNPIDYTFISGSGFKAVRYQHVSTFWALASTDHIPLLLDIDLR